MSGIVVFIFILRILLVSLLFGFLFWTAVTIWRDLRTQGKFISVPDTPTLSLTKIANDDEEEAAPEIFDHPEITVGRSLTSDYIIADETVSARHARLSYHHNQWWIEDFRSTNGTFLNDERVSVPTVIVTGDEIRIGQISLLIEIKEKVN